MKYKQTYLLAIRKKLYLCHPTQHLEQNGDFMTNKKNTIVF